ncbi:hypothetical protein [Mycobacterium celatum]|uniref:Uncharacterized protein n=1 Tax=Mycobacterium celatum TaxID=28045 RepID=A0A1X1RMX4_MYCCE|nr:hypothetical protein [Mycobacterium celatum]ORV09971.1 hypothetical protein AWB95_17310 [Mycobacterium celatum]PIB75480.1 hypothetical protein CQY23_19860 [Mycobacterium celatum]
MPRLTTRFRSMYGSGPLHLLTMVGGFALLAYLIVTAGPSALLKPEGAWWKSIALWFGAAIVFHDLVLFPVYSVADQLLGVAVKYCREPLVPLRNHLRVPALGSGLILLIFLPDIIEQGAEKYFEDTGLTQQPFFGRWLMLTAIMFGASAVIYTIRVTVTRRRASRTASKVLR